MRSPTSSSVSATAPRATSICRSRIGRPLRMIARTFDLQPAGGAAIVRLRAVVRQTDRSLTSNGVYQIKGTYGAPDLQRERKKTVTSAGDKNSYMTRLAWRYSYLPHQADSRIASLACDLRIRNYQRMQRSSLQTASRSPATRSIGFISKNHWDESTRLDSYAQP